MRYKDTPKRRVLKASDEIRLKYAASPIIALYRDEADDIFDNVLDEDSIEGFYEWLDEWKRFVFKTANFVIKSRKAKDPSVYATYRVCGRQLVVNIFAESAGCSVELRINPDEVNLAEMQAGMESMEDRGMSWKELSLPIDFEYRKDLDARVNVAQSDFDAKAEILRIAQEEAIKEGEPYDNETLRKILDDPGKTVAEKKAYSDIHISVNTKGMNACQALMDLLDAKIQFMESILKELHQTGASRVCLIILATLYHFQIRAPKVYARDGISDHEGYKKHNDMYNPLKKLNPPAIIRPRNGTRSWFETQRMKHTESWHVKGHSRVLKAERYKGKRGQTIWINPFIKGSGENMRLSIYVDKVGSDMVEVNETSFV